MVGRSVDVSLRIKAQDEASKALDTVGKALRDLAGAQNALSGGSNSVGQFVENLGRNVDQLSAVFKKLDTSLAGANRAYDANARQIAAVNASIDERKRRIEQLAKSEADLQRIQGNYKNIGPSRQATFVGPVPPRLSTLRGELGRETGALAKEEAALQKLITKTAEARQAAIEIRGVQGQVATALDVTTNAFVKQANALDQLTAAEKRANDQARERQRNAAVRDTINENTGVNRTGTPGSLRNIRQADLEGTFAPVFRAEDNQIAEEAKKSATAFAELQRYARDVAESLDPVARVSRMVAEEQERLSAAVRAGALSQTQADAALSKYRASLDGTAAATDRQGREFAELSNYVQELRRDFDRAGYAERFLAQETEKLNRAVKAGILTQNEYSRALESVRRKSEQLGEKSNPTLFGLAPYQTQNLLFQFNDIATQLASGTSITQTLAQQGGQILQLFPRAGNAIVAAFSAVKLAIAPVVAVIAGLVIGINEAIDASARLRELNAVLGANADGANFSATQVVASAKAMREFGVAIDEAMQIARTAIKAGFDQTEILAFGESAKGLSIILGTDVPTAAKTLADALNGGLDALIELDKQTNTLTATQLKNIISLVDQGKAIEAATMFADIYQEKLSDVARDSQGPWQVAINELKTAWDELKASLADSLPVQLAVQSLTGLARVATGIAQIFTTTTDSLSKYTENSKRIQELMTEGRGGGLFGGPLRDRATINPDGTLTPKPFAANDPQTNRDIEEVNRLNRENIELSRKINEANKTAADTASNAAQKRVDAIERETEALKQQGKVTDEQTKKERLATDAKAIRREVTSRLNIGVNSTPEEAAAAEEQIKERLRQKEREYTEQIKQTVEARNRAAEAAKREAEQLEKQRNTGAFQAAELLRSAEGFRNKAYFDVNAFRAGFGSDTVTRADGTVQRVTSSTTVTRADAERDLARRIQEFTNVVKQQIGSERFGQFNAQQQGALISLAYNYGRLPDRILDEVRTGTIPEIAAAVRGLSRDNNGVNAGRREREARLLETPNLAVDQGAEQAAEDAQAKLDKYNETLDERLARESRSVANQKALVGLQGEALRKEIERQQIAEQIERATEDLRQATGDPDAELAQAQVDRITLNVRARLQLDEPAKVFADLQKQLDDIQGFRGLLGQQLQEAQQTGDVGGVARLQEQIQETDLRIAEAAANLQNFLNTPGNPEALGLYGQELDNLLFKLEALKDTTVDWQLTLGGATITAQQFANTFTNSAVNAIDQFAQAIANGRDAFGSLWDAFRTFAADFLLQIARMIQQQIIFNLISGLLSAVGGAIGGGTGGGTSLGAVAGLRAHSGGVIGQPSTYGPNTGFRTVNPAWFANAARCHTGGIAGLKPGEVPAVLMRGEEVLTRDDPRHMMNGGGGGNVKIVNAFDEGDVISKAMETKAGERAVLNLVRKNPRAFRTAMGGG